MVIATSLLDMMIAHAREGAPEEVCGMLARDGDRICDVYRITNVDHSPTFYVMDSQEQLRAILDIEDVRGLEVGGAYHSHPATEPRPSKRDIELARWPGVEYLIVSLRDPINPEVKAWRIDDGAAVESELQIVDA